MSADLKAAAQQAQDTKREMLAVADAFIRGKRAALAQKEEPAQEPVAWRFKPMIGSPWSLSDDGYYISCKRDKGYIVEPLYAAPRKAEPVQEPAFHGFMSDDGTQVDVCFSPSAPRRDGTYATAYYTAPPQRPAKPVE